MRKAQKSSLLEIIGTLYDAHKVAQKYIEKGEFDNAVAVLSECQNAAINLGEIVEKSEGEDFVTISFFQQYCDELYNVGVSIGSNDNANKIKKALDRSLMSVENSIKNDIKVRLEVVFMPYKASMWDSLESIWTAADKDPDCDAYVVPIPYYDRKADHSFGEFHYEGAEYPDYVPIVHYEAYNLEKRKPDIIYIHNPYDDRNYVTSVDPRFYSFELKKYTDMLVYVPYFIASSYPDERAAATFIAPPVIKYTDYIIYQSPVQLEILRNLDLYNDNALVLGQPKLDAVINMKKPDIPNEEWKKCFAFKKVIVFASTLGYLLDEKDPAEWINFTIRAFKSMLTFKDILIIWRPHPLTDSTIAAMRPQIITAYKDMVNSIMSNDNCIIDKNPDSRFAMTYADAMISEGSSLVQQYAMLEKPILNYFFSLNPKYVTFDMSEIYTPYKLIFPGRPLEEVKTFTYDDEHIYFDGIEKFCEMVLNNQDPNKEKRMELIRNSVVNCDGTAGEKIHKRISDEVANK